MLGSPFRATFSCSASCTGFALVLVGKPFTSRARLAWVTLGAKWMLAMPEPESIFAKPFSAAADSRGVPSRRSCSPETAKSRPASLSEPSAVFSSDHAVSYCLEVRGCPKSYILANLRRILRLRTKARAAACRVLMLVVDMSLGGLGRQLKFWVLRSVPTMVLVLNIEPPKTNENTASG